MPFSLPGVHSRYLPQLNISRTQGRVDGNYLVSVTAVFGMGDDLGEAVLEMGEFAACLAVSL
jgi:hypothetical protein